MYASRTQERKIVSENDAICARSTSKRGGGNKRAPREFYPLQLSAHPGGRPGNTTRATVTALASTGRWIPVTVALDSFAARDMVHHSLARGVKEISPVTLRGIGGMKSIAKSACLLLKSGRKRFEIRDALVDDGSSLPRGCHALLSSGSLSALRVDMNAHLRQAAKGVSAAPLKFQEGSQESHDRDKESPSASQLEASDNKAGGESILPRREANGMANAHPLSRVAGPARQQDSDIASFAREQTLIALSAKVKEMVATERKIARREDRPPETFCSAVLRHASSQIQRLLDSGRHAEAERAGGVGILTEIYLALEQEKDEWPLEDWWSPSEVECYISDQRVGEYLERVGHKVPRPPLAQMDDVDHYDGPVDGESAEESSVVSVALRNAVREFADVFTRTSDMPKPLRTTPHVIPLKAGARRCWTPQPRGRPNTNKFLHQYYSQGLRSGLYEYPKGATNASMTVLANKNGPGGKVTRTSRSVLAPT